MIRSELADELGVNSSTVQKWLDVYAQLTERTIERRLDDQTINDMQRARTLMLEHPGMIFREALERALDLFVEPVPPASVKRLMGRLDGLESTLAGIEERQMVLQNHLQALADHLKMISEDLRTLLSGGADAPTLADNGSHATEWEGPTF
ncbi:hypothetical protein GCM10010840_08930 [Deinococcus aerolatus]|uniref:Helix-turn-helix domain-containing protein n=1 Tax=Deinococcus aerolatus TaxID=522487 RepID=A0ABQ2G448_9DEIO|nr:hypothetical protein [Deinococcus aerolatus]GGL73109.1 hypothetical protein GCM10010840_08930 [Deinococcus aerolatus]